MHFIQTIVLGLATAVSTTTAIDIYLKTGGGCGNFNAVVCQGINPDTCCGGSSVDIFPSVGFYGIPTNWVISCRGHSGGNCRNLREVQRAANTNFVCLNNGWFSGGGYGFTSLKRGAPVDAVAALEARGGECPASGGCTKWAKPDLLELVDGGKYEIAGLEGEALTKMELLVVVYYNLAAAGANSTDIDEEFHDLKIE